MTDKKTSLHIAALAGVSQPTVSRALRGSPSVSAKTRQRIEAIARELNYAVDKNASNLRAKHTHTLALLFFEDPTSDDSSINPFFLSMLGSITRACAAEGQDLLISFQRSTGGWDGDFAASRRADGIILLGYGDYEQYRRRLEALAARGTRFVCWGQWLADQPGLSVGCDNFDGGLRAARHLIALGRRRIVFLGTASHHYPEFLERYRGYCAALQACADPATAPGAIDAISTERSGCEAARRLIASGTRFDAIVAASDLIAIGALRGLAEAGIDVPGSVALVGFDDIPGAAFANPALTTVMQDTRAAGTALVATLLKLVRGDAATSLILPARLVVRRSCGAPQAAGNPPPGA
jgi:DNA-binding LacI/PurR family transcriptional regulator